VKIPLPAFYFDATNDDEWLVVDGLQRLMTLKRFAIDRTLRLRNLEFLKDLNGLVYDELPRHLQRRIAETQVTAYRIQVGTPAPVKFTIFRRINTGGLPLSAQEIRHALNQGQVTKFLLNLAESMEFKIATDFGLRNDRMADRECVLRFVTFFRRPFRDYALQDFDAFLSSAMADLNTVSQEELDRCAEAFYRSMHLAQTIFGKDAFRKLARKSQRPPINKALFEAWSVGLAQINESLLSLGQIYEIRRLGERLLANDTFFNESISLGTGSPRKLHYRFQEVQNVINAAIASQ
jgi:hypothetical protein